MSAPRLLFLCHTLPYPPDGGVWIRTYHVLRLLSRRYRVTALCFERSGGRAEGHDVGAAVDALGRWAHRVEAFPVPQEESRTRWLRDHLTSLLVGRPFTVFKHRSPAFEERVDAELADGGHDLVHVDSMDLSGFLPRLGGAPVVCVHHNVESDLLRRRARLEASRWRRWYLRRQASFQEEEERRWCGRVDLNVAVSERDRDRLEEIAPDADVAVVPNGVDTDHWRPRDEPVRERSVVFVGSATWFPNRDALEHFCGAILPRLRERVGDVTVAWVGTAPDDLVDRYRREHGVRLTGYVDDVRPHVAEAACYVVPLRVGGGSRLKIVEAWAMGKAVVSTPVGCEGLSAVDGENVLVRRSPDAFAGAVAEVLSDPDLRGRLGSAARRTAVEEYGWDGIGKHLHRLYGELA